jgi:hypothetical protein
MLSHRSIRQGHLFLAPSTTPPVLPAGTRPLVRAPLLELVTRTGGAHAATRENSLRRNLPIATDPIESAPRAYAARSPCHQGHPDRRPAASDDERDADVIPSANARVRRFADFTKLQTRDAKCLKCLKTQTLTLIPSLLLQQNFPAPPQGVRDSVRRHSVREQAVSIEKKRRHAGNTRLARRPIGRPNFLAAKIAN